MQARMSVYLPNSLPGKVVAIGLHGGHDLLLMGFDARFAALGQEVDQDADEGLVDSLVPPGLGFGRGGHDGDFALL